MSYTRHMAHMRDYLGVLKPLLRGDRSNFAAKNTVPIWKLP